MNKVLTIAIPAYNTAEETRYCLQTIVDSNCLNDIEILLIDDESTDSTPSVGNEYEAAYPQSVHYIRKQNGHYGSSVNMALDNATGTYFKVIDGDDYVMTKGLEDLVCWIKTHAQVDLIVSDFTVERPDGMRKNVSNIAPYRDYCGPELLEYGSFDKNAITYRTELLKKNEFRLTERIPYVDLEYAILPGLYISKAAYCPSQVYVYRSMRDGSTSDPNTIAALLEKHHLVIQGMINWYQLHSCDSDNKLNHVYVSKGIASSALFYIGRISKYLKFSEGYKKYLELIDELERVPQILVELRKAKSIRLLARTRNNFLVFMMLAVRTRMKSKESFYA